jgi:hypothetical protein
VLKRVSKKVISAKLIFGMVVTLSAIAEAASPLRGCYFSRKTIYPTNRNQY